MLKVLGPGVCQPGRTVCRNVGRKTFIMSTQSVISMEDGGEFPSQNQTSVLEGRLIILLEEKTVPIHVKLVSTLISKAIKNVCPVRKGHILLVVESDLIVGTSYLKDSTLKQKSSLKLECYQTMKSMWLKNPIVPILDGSLKETSLLLIPKTVLHP